ncbi:hypothetical protein K2173_027811 [Erythroxylum novogranatense]|uniref:Embryonic flower 1-like protein n=1 Tax=Erythroxylum novogranatense TaxID=1862640 RepID=A0AAV8U3D0_9ROSI|nr:hypothetical protein K2173_027811 [Erythroxylum novogranatense]
MEEMIETDKSCTGRDMRRGARKIKQSGRHKLVSGFDVVSLEKSRKARIKRLSSSQEENCQMVYDVSDGELEPHLQAPSRSSFGTDKRFKLSSKLLDECNGVDHSSVPRKLRSATKTRNRESISPPFPDPKKRNQSAGGLESPNKRDGVKKLKSKLNMKQGVLVWSTEESVCGPITKDEEEVVETLYALAGMFLDNRPNSKKELENASLDELPSALPEASETTPTLEDKDLKSDSGNESADPASVVEKSSEDIVADASTIKEQVDNRSVGPAKHEEGKPACGPVDFSTQHMPNYDTCTMEQPTLLETPLSNPGPDIEQGQSTAKRQPDHQLKTEDSDQNGGLVLSSGLSTISSNAWSCGPSSQSSAAKIPFWLDTATCATRPGSWKDFSSNGKVKVNTDRNSWKKCATHVHISQFIRLLQVSLLNQGAITMINDLNDMRNESNGVTSASGVVNITESNPIEARTDILEYQRLCQNQPQASLASGTFTSQKQIFNFLETNDTLDRTANGSEPLTHHQYPYIHSQVQHSTIVPAFSMSRHKTAYPNQPSAAAAKQVQLQPTYLGNPFYGSPGSNLPLSKQQVQHHQKLQQKKQLWAAQMLAQYRNMEISSPMTQFPSWQKGQETQVIIPLSSPADVLNSNLQKQDHHLSSVYEETGGRFQAGGASALQLLCNERL